ncbi:MULTISPECIES: hypothetical protein [Lysobacter]|uniref:hypothetical protein n=1 Tax=Lysobacter TaxID=68 RepID=UPI001F27E575|nr:MULTISPECIES: hypothetical protein [Lysobacter]UJB19274.1 hypothetical protein L1A79_23665 [Lysobacter capsici]UJQ27001.1 hypothetical protein L2D09_16220 [Lysobacter gummosus]
MPNKPYCRFRNTLNDLNECYYWLDEMIHAVKPVSLSREELAAAKEMVVTCLDIVNSVCEAGDVRLADEPDLAALLDTFNHGAAAR